ncbi:hypothetical protein [Cohnella sp. GCM10012308]|uniref:hypothetical protein n=1 Tax=Cohnella sp. GCM10012308 TaxID=3317329 RepID=UPI003610CB58
MARVTKSQAQKLVGRHIYAVRKDRSVVYGKLVAIKGDSLILERRKGKQVQTKAIIPLVLFDILAIGTAPFAGGWGAWGGGLGGGFGGGLGGWW